MHSRFSGPFDSLYAIQVQRPLILHYTNSVSAEFIANALLALGASPLVSSAEEEVEELVHLASSVVLNIGTVEASALKSMERAARIARSQHKPVVLDPVGAGTSQWRSFAARSILNTRSITHVRANASEMQALVDENVRPRGADTNALSDTAIAAARHLSREYHLVAIVSGATDWIVSENNQVGLKNGSPWMAQVTGMGCAVSSVVGTFAAVSSDSFRASVEAMATFSLCGERAAKRCLGPGSFKVGFIDYLHTWEDNAWDTLIEVTP
jgi:hydroxyethylthiazole kinase